MTVQDRTTEFFAAIEAIQQRGTGAMQAAQLMNRLDDRQRLLSSTPTSASSVGLSQPRVLKERSEFTRMAAHIGRSIAATSAKLEQLATLAKKKSLFDDRPTEINDLTFSIKGDITQISGDLKHLESYLRSHSMGNNQIQEHSSNIVVSLQSKLASTSHSFKDVLEIRSSNLKEQKARRDQLSFAPSTSKALQPQQESALYQPEKKDFVSISMPQLQQQLIPAQVSCIWIVLT
jgi:syntaxin 5